MMLGFKIFLLLFCCVCFSETLQEVPELKYEDLSEDVFYPETIQGVIDKYHAVAKNNLEVLRAIHSALHVEAFKYQKLAYEKSENRAFARFYLFLAEVIRSGGPALKSNLSFDIEKHSTFFKENNWYLAHLYQIKETSEAYLQSIQRLSSDHTLQDKLILEYQEWSVRQINKYHLKLPSFSTSSKMSVQELVNYATQIAISFESEIQYEPLKKLDHYIPGSISDENRHSFPLFFASLGKETLSSKETYILRGDALTNVYMPKDTVKVLSALKDWKILYTLLGRAKYREANFLERFLNNLWLYPLPNYNLKNNALVFKFNSAQDCVDLLYRKTI